MEKSSKRKDLVWTVALRTSSSMLSLEKLAPSARQKAHKTEAEL